MERISCPEVDGDEGLVGGEHFSRVTRADVLLALLQPAYDRYRSELADGARKTSATPA